MIRLNPGERYGSLTVLQPAPPSDRYPQKRMWLCRCDCGNEVALPAIYIKNGVVTTCGCGRHKPKVDATGEKHGKLTAVRATGEIYNHSAVWLWQCDCGNTVEATLDIVRWGNKRSCGCRKSQSELENAKLARAVYPRAEKTSLALISSRKPYASSSSGVRGVSWHKARKKWLARITFQGKSFHLGYFSDLNDAARARKEAEANIFDGFLDWYAETHPEEWKKWNLGDPPSQKELPAEDDNDAS